MSSQEYRSVRAPDGSKHRPDCPKLLGMGACDCSPSESNNGLCFICDYAGPCQCAQIENARKAARG